MSIPHTGKLEAIVNGHRCSFDGDSWITPEADLTAVLNDATKTSPKTHFSILERARHVLNKTALLPYTQILSVEFDQWKTEIPDDAID